MRADPDAVKQARQQRAKDLTGWCSYPLATSGYAAPELQVRSVADKGACIPGKEAPSVVPRQWNCSEGFQDFRWHIEYGYGATQHQQDRPPADSDCCAVEQPIVTSEHPAAPEEIGIVGTSDRADYPWQQSNQQR